MPVPCWFRASAASSAMVRCGVVPFTTKQKGCRRRLSMGDICIQYHPSYHHEILPLQTGVSPSYMRYDLIFPAGKSGGNGA
jgi:hypothetical protein